MRSFNDHLARLSDEDIVLDLGANVGDYTATLSATGAQVHAFEPEPRLFAHLQRRFSDHPNVFLHQAAISAEAGEVEFWVQNSDERGPLELDGHSLIKDNPVTEGGCSITVACVDFFAFVASLAKVPSLTKMDIEGAEVAILERMWQTETESTFGTLYVETHERQIPELQDRTIALHNRVGAMQNATINLFWP